MAKVTFKHSSAGYRAVMNSEAVKAMLDNEAARIAARANAEQTGYEHAVVQTGDRPAGRVWPGTREAGIDNSRHNTLLKSRGW